MSLKNFACVAALVALFASSAAAVPTLSVDFVRTLGNPTLNSAGDWQWMVMVDPDDTLFNSGLPNTAIAGEVAFSNGGNALLNGITAGSDYIDDNPGVLPSTGFSWAVADGEGDFVGVQVDPTGAEAFAHLGGDASAATPGQYVIITAAGPDSSDPSTLTATLNYFGSHDSDKYRLSQGGVNTDTAGGTSTFSTLVGDANLDGIVNSTDLILLSGNWLGTGGWAQGNFNNGVDSDINSTDLILLSGNWLQSAGAAVSSVSGAAVPEPSSLILLGLGSLLALVRRRS